MAQDAAAAASLDAVLSAADAAQMTQQLQRQALARAELVALGRETIGELQYFEDLGLSSDDSFLLSLGRRGAARAETQPRPEALSPPAPP